MASSRAASVGCGVSERRRRPRGERLAQRRHGRDEVQRIGVQHHRQRQRQRAGDELRGAGVGAQPRPDDQRVDGARQHGVRGAQHQLRRRPVDGRRSEGREAEAHLARPLLHRGAAGEQQRADHAFGAADDAQRAVGSLVHVALGAGEHARQRRGERRPVEAMASRGLDRLGVEAEVVHGDRAAEIDAFAGQQPRLQRDERRRRGGADARAGRGSGVGVEAGGHVEGEDRRRQGVGALDQRRVVGRQRARESDAEQSVDDERAAPAFRDVGDRAAARGGEGAVRRRGVGGQPGRVAAEHHRDVVESRAQQPRDDERVAAVVAGAGEHQDRAAALARHGRRDVGRRQPGALHQRLALRRRLDGPQVRGAVDRQQAGTPFHPGIIGRRRRRAGAARARRRR